MQQSIGWYPGHMAKARRLLTEQLKRIDIAIELCDARLPLSSRNPDLDLLLQNRPRLLLLNKSDLANPTGTKEWLAYFSNQGIHCLRDDAQRQEKHPLCCGTTGS